MANRVTAEEVKAIIDVDSSVTDVSAFIKVANLLVTDKLVGTGLSDDHLKEIERWLSAHFIAMRDPRAQTETMGEASVTYQGSTGEALDSTLYGQQAKILDTTGLLSKLGSKKASIGVVNYTTS